LKVSFLYTLTFIVAFLAVTGLLIIANERFQNIFKFDFSPVKVVASADTSAQIKFTENTVVPDTIKSVKDTLAKPPEDTSNIQKPKVESPAITAKNKQVSDISNNTNQAVQTVQNLPEEKIKPLETDVMPKTPDSTYNKWKKATVRIYEAMDARKVAQVLTSLSDSEARELIYSMKKKKAAEILSNLNAESVKRLTRLQ
jgi:flagellar motility protein MotE (MotC chaperone)